MSLISNHRFTPQGFPRTLWSRPLPAGQRARPFLRSKLCRRLQRPLGRGGRHVQDQHSLYSLIGGRLAEDRPRPDQQDSHDLVHLADGGQVDQGGPAEEGLALLLQLLALHGGGLGGVAEAQLEVQCGQL